MRRGVCKFWEQSWDDRRASSKLGYKGENSRYHAIYGLVLPLVNPSGFLSAGLFRVDRVFRVANATKAEIFEAE